MRNIIVFFSLGILLVSCTSKQEKVVPSIRVEATEAVVQDVPIFIEAIGNIFENSIVQIRPQIQGILLKAYVEQGQFVNAGDLLYEIDPRPYQAVLDQAKATLLKDQAAVELAKSTVKRYTDLANKDFVSPLTFEQYQTNVMSTEAQVEIDKAAIESAQINLDYSKIFSPINGKISVYNIFPGNLVVVNDPNALTEIRQISPIDVRFSIPQRDFQRIQQSQSLENLKFEVTLPYDKNRKFEGYLYFVDNHVNLETGTILLKGLAANEDKILWPGEFVRVRIILETQKNAVVVPFSALQSGQRGFYAYIVQPDMSVKTVDVTVGERIDTLIVIDSGISAGDKIVTNGQLNLRNGSKVQIINSDTASKANP